MTWSFLFLVCLLVGLATAAIHSLLQRITSHRVCHNVVVPAPEHRSALINLIAQRASSPLIAFGAVGLALYRTERETRVLSAVAVGLVAALLATIVLRRWRVPPPPARAKVVREIPANGFGQVQVEQRDRRIVLAAKSADGRSIPVGSEIEMVDCDSSVLTVRQVSFPASTA